VELEWPARMRLGDSDVIRLSLIPTQDGYKVTTEFPDHTTDTQDVVVLRPVGFRLQAVARLEGVGFEFSPQGDQALDIPAGQPLTWYWSLQPERAGQQRLAVRLSLHWEPLDSHQGGARETLLYNRALNVQVSSFFGLNRSQALTGGLFGLLLGAGMILFGAVYQPAGLRSALQIAEPNPTLAIELPPDLRLSSQEDTLLRTLFRRYGRLVLESEFLSGYSGARTFLARPLHPDGRADAHTIVKIGERVSVAQEYTNYERFVKDTLPAVTARIQHAPVSVRNYERAAIQYTFVGAPGQPPTSLRQALLADPDPRLLTRLFETFGPNWWMQRRPYTFRLALEYDRLLPTHLVIEPVTGESKAFPMKVLDGRTAPELLALQHGDLVNLHGFPHMERRSDGRSLSLLGSPLPGQPPLRVRWHSLQNPNGAAGRVIATRQALLQGWVENFDRFGLPDPLPSLQALLRQNISATQSTIHGDLNLENVLVGPGGFVWLIDFAMTRDGHTLFDFAHLGASIVAEVIAPQMSSVQAYLKLLAQKPFEPGARPDDPLGRLLAELCQIANRCLFNPSQPGEFLQALNLACLGALKFENLNDFQKHVLYLTAGELVSHVKVF
jgi:hypothetical protein